MATLTGYSGIFLLLLCYFVGAYVASMIHRELDEAKGYMRMAADVLALLSVLLSSYLLMAIDYPESLKTAVLSGIAILLFLVPRAFRMRLKHDSDVFYGFAAAISVSSSITIPLLIAAFSSYFVGMHAYAAVFKSKKRQKQEILGSAVAILLVSVVVYTAASFF